MSALSQIAKDPSCLLAVSAQNGGSWLATLRPNAPRNFAADPMTWTDAMTAANQIGSDDWSFQIKMNVLSQIQQASGEIFNNDSGSPLKIYGDLIASGSAAFYLRNYVELETWTGTHKLQLDVVSGNATLYVDGTLIATKPTGLSTLNFTRASKTSADIEIEFVEFRNLTTGETVWQASRDDLFETNNPWPSPVPRNFVEEPETWYDFQMRAIAVSPINYTMTLRVLIPDTDGYIWSASGASAVFTARRSGRDVIVSMQPGTANYGQTTINDVASGEHTLVWSKSGTTATIYLDGELVVNFAGVAGDTQWASRVVPATNVGTILYAELKDDAANEIVWSYPTWEERTRLLTKTNVRTDRGVFEAADMSRRWDVTTQLRAASLLPECTIIVEADNPNGEAVTFVSCAQRANPTQGFFVIRKQDAGSLLFGYSGKNSSGAMVYPNRYIEYPDGKHVFVFVLDYSALQLRIYIDGAEVDNRAMDVNVVAPPEFDETVKPVILGVTSDGLNLTTKISHCLIFDRALTASEIAALSYAVV